MSATTTSTSVSASSTACNVNWQIPTTDAACAAVIRGNVTNAMDKCCGKASPEKYQDDCAIYCPAVGQDVEKLFKCIQDESGNYNDVFCNAANNATATATGSKPTTGTATGTGATSTSTNAALVNQPVSKSGLGLAALMFGSAFMAVLA